MEHTWMIKYLAEFFGTIILVVLGNGSVANSVLRDTGGNSRDGQANGGWLLIAFGFGFGVMLPAMLFGSISGNHLNPAVTLAQACAGAFPWDQVLPYILVQMLGAIVGQLILVAVYWPYIKRTASDDAVFASFATGDTANSKLNGFITICWYSNSFVCSRWFIPWHVLQAIRRYCQPRCWFLNHRIGYGCWWSYRSCIKPCKRLRSTYRLCTLPIAS